MTVAWGELRIRDYLAALGAVSPTPGGGSAAALAGALSSALGRMVVSVAREKEPTPEREALAAAFQELEERFLELAAEDERAFSAVMEALRIPRDAEGRFERLQTALLRAADVPLRAAESSLSVLRRLEQAEAHASRAIVSDVGVATHLALASLRSSLLNVAVNAGSLKDVAVSDRLERDAAALRDAAEEVCANIVRRVDARLAPHRS
jgi:formiminotetrahydrofolate cyclodeaminase